MVVGAGDALDRQLAEKVLHFNIKLTSAALSSFASLFSLQGTVERDEFEMEWRSVGTRNAIEIERHSAREAM